MKGDAKKRILARRAKFVAAAVASMGAIGCSSSDPTPQADASPGTISQPDACLSDSRFGEPEVCLSPPLDTGAADTAPMPCLDPAPEDTGTADTDPTDTGPAPCLKMPPPDAG